MIAETEKQYQQLVEALPIATLAIRDGCVTYANQACARMFGFSDSEEMVGLPALDLVASESHRLVTERIARFEKGQDNPTAEIELLRRDGSRFIAESTSVSILVEGERVGGIALRDITKIKESEKVFQERFRLQELISRISAKFINPSVDEFEQAIQDALAEIVGYFDVDAVRLFKLSYQGDTLEARVSWRSPSLAPPKEIPELYKKKAPTFAAHYAEGNSLVFSKYDGYPEWKEWGEIMAFLGIEAGVRVPLEVDDSGITAFAIDKIMSDEAWPEEIVEHMKAVGRVMLGAMRRKEAENERQKHFRFQELVSRISGKFINPPEDEFEQTVQNALAEIAEYFNVDAVRLYRLSLKGDLLEVRNSWQSEGLAPAKEVPGLRQRKYPNFAAHYLKGESVVFSRYDDSPDWPEMRDVLKFLGVMAGVGVPLEVDDSGVDVFAMDKVLVEYVWPEDIVEHSKAIGRVILGAMRRRETEEELHDSMDEIKRLKDRLEQENIYLRAETGAGYQHDKIIGDSETIKEILVAIYEAAEMAIGTTHVAKWNVHVERNLRGLSRRPALAQRTRSKIRLRRGRL